MKGIKMTQKYYLLKIEKLVLPDWSSTVFYSKLYKSRDACRKGCQTDELILFIDAVLRNLDAKETGETTILDVIEGDADEFISFYEKKDKHAAAFVEKVKEWLNQERCEDSLYGDDSLFWEITELEPAE